MKRSVPLEPAAGAVCDQSAAEPRIYQMPPSQGRRRLEEAQNLPVNKYPANIKCTEVETGKWGRIPVYFVTPVNKDISSVIFYIHGAGWVFGSFHTHEKLVRELCARTNALMVFPEYTRSPEAKYPAAIEQCYCVLSHIWELVDGFYVSKNRNVLTLAGDSVGGNMAIAMVLMALQQGGPVAQKLLLYYPVTNACFDTSSYHQFAKNYYLYREQMKWFWDQYAPDLDDRRQMMASPLCAGREWLKKFPSTMIINGQADVLRSEGEAFGEKLRCAGVDVTAIRVQGTIHDFVMLNALDQTNACRTAMDASTVWLNRSNGSMNENT